MLSPRTEACLLVPPCLEPEGCAGESVFNRMTANAVQASMHLDGRQRSCWIWGGRLLPCQQLLSLLEPLQSCSCSR